MESLLHQFDLLLHGEATPEDALAVAIALTTSEEARKEFQWSLEFMEGFHKATEEHENKVTPEVKTALESILVASRGE